MKLGKFELDNLLSEKRILTLTGNGGIYQLYHFIPQGDGNIFGQMGDNQLGVEVMGHNYNDRTRYSAALLSSNDGTTSTFRTATTYTGFFTASQAFDAGRAGVQRIGGYAMVGRSADHMGYSDGDQAARCIPGSGIGNKSFSREGFVGLFYFGQHADLTVVTQHGEDSAWFGQGYGDLIDGIATEQQYNGNHSSRRSTISRLERRPVRTALHLQSAAYLHWPLRNDSHVAAIDSGNASESRQHLNLHNRPCVTTHS